MIPERHQDGRLHAHAIETGHLTTRWFKDEGRECGLGYIAEEKEVRSPAGAGAYVVKYLTKVLNAEFGLKIFGACARLAAGQPCLN